MTKRPGRSAGKMKSDKRPFFTQGGKAGFEFLEPIVYRFVNVEEALLRC